MKRLSVFLLLLGLAGCNYPSRSQAETGCEVWADKNREVTFVETIPSKPYKSSVEEELEKLDDDTYYSLKEKEQFRSNLYKFDDIMKSKSVDKTITHKVGARWCIEEEKTKQFLGYENKAVLNGTWQNVKGMTGEGKVVKHFRY